VKVIPLFGEGIAGKSYVVTRQRRLNCYFENRRDRDKTKVAVYGTPGLVAAFQPSTPLSQPLRGFLGTQGALYIVGYNQFQSISSTGTALATGTLGTTAGIVSMAFSPTQVVIADGAAGYLFIPATSAFSTINASFPNGARTTTFVSGFFVAEQPGTQQFWTSNVNDGSTWNSLAFASASSYSDNILAVDNLLGNLILFCQLHMEFWQNVGTAPQPFAPILSAANEFGLAAIFSRAHVNQTIIFLAQTREGQVQFVQVNGYSVAVISNPDLEYIINQFSVVSDAVGLSYEIDTHKFYQVTFPTANRSFLFDTSTGLWSDVQTGPSVTPSRHWGNLSAYYAGKTLISDYATNQVYTQSVNQFTDNGQIIVREIITRHILSDFNRVRISLVYLDMETGVGLQSGQGSNPQIMLQYSKDNGRTWSAERWVSSGLVGQYLTRVLWRRFGSTRDATFRIRMSDPVKFVITEGAIKIAERPQ
jgi:Phage stabilisation protein